MNATENLELTQLLRSGRTISSCSTSVTRHVTIVRNPVISHECEKDGIVITSNGTFPNQMLLYFITDPCNFIQCVLICGNVVYLTLSWFVRMRSVI